MMNNNFKLVKNISEKIIGNLRSVIIGKENSLKLITIGLFCQGHVLIEDVPGVGKTVLAKALAKSIGCVFSRIQFTPDMLPSDVTGVTIYNQSNHEFVFRPGPLMANIVLADEINRATPKTQSALLEAMEERQITVDGNTHRLSNPFLVIATQNPIEYEGTFPLPEAQLDRFLIKIDLGYPEINDEINIIDAQQYNHPLEKLDIVASTQDILICQETIKSIYVSKNIKKYIVDIVRATRDNSDIYLGSSPRGSLGLFRSSQALAAIEGRDFVLPDDIKRLAKNVLVHRIILNPSIKIKGITPELLLDEILNSLPIPITE